MVSLHSLTRCHSDVRRNPLRVILALCMIVLSFSNFILTALSESPCDPQRLNSTITFLSDKLAKDPLDTVAGGMLGFKLLEKIRRERSYDKLTEIQRILDTTLAQDESPSSIILRGSFLSAAHKFSDALKELQPFLDPTKKTKDSDRLAASLLAIDVMIEVGQVTQAQSLLKKIEATAKSPLTILRSARILEVTGKGPSAIEMTNKVIAENFEQSDKSFDTVWLLLQQGERLVRWGELEAAAKVYSEAQKICPDYWMIDEHLAELEAIRGSKNIALEKYKFLAEQKQLPGLFESVALLIDSTKRKEAEPYAQRASEIYRHSVDNGEVLFLHHLAALIDEFFDKPCDALPFALRDLTERRTPFTLQQSAWISFRCGDTIHAHSLIEEALGSGYSDPHFDYRAGVLVSGLGEREKGKDLIRRAIKKNPWVNAFHSHR